jgi:hypothetical protein
MGRAEMLSHSYIIILYAWNYPPVLPRDGIYSRYMGYGRTHTSLGGEKDKKKVLLQMLRPIHQKLRIRNALLFHALSMVSSGRAPFARSSSGGSGSFVRFNWLGNQVQSAWSWFTDDSYRSAAVRDADGYNRCVQVSELDVSRADILLMHVAEVCRM